MKTPQGVRSDPDQEPTREPQPHMVRARVDSDGSTRGAFYQHGAGKRATSTTTRKKKTKRSSESSLPDANFGDWASLAISGADATKKEPAKRRSSGALNRSTPQSSLSRAMPLTLPLNKPEALPRSDYTTGAEKPLLSPQESSSHHTGYGRNPSTVLESGDSFELSETSPTAAFQMNPTMSSTYGSQQKEAISMFSAMAQSEPTDINAFSAMAQADPRDINSFSAMAQADPEEVNAFSAMPRGGYGAISTYPARSKQRVMPTVIVDPARVLPPTSFFDSLEPLSPLGDDMKYDREDGQQLCWMDRIMYFLDPTDWLLADLKHDEDGQAYFDESSEWNLAGWFRHFFFNPEVPEFTSLQQFTWAVILGVVMGFYTAMWKSLIEHCVHFVWNTVPSHLFLWGFFPSSFPLANYMWIIPTIFGSVLSYLFAILTDQIPGQNEWIHAVHSRGVQDHNTFLHLFALSTAGMASGLALGPELPLVLTGGMFGSYIGVLCKQSMLQARVMNLTAASAAVGGFFGFPMAGALFVLEIPHRMGLQYFEALSPATIASIIAVLVNRIVTGDDVTGYFKYPFLTDTLPSKIFTSAVVYGVFGGVVGIGYANGILKVKKIVHELFSDHSHQQAHDDTEENEGEKSAAPEIFEDEEATPLFKQAGQPLHKVPIGFIESTRASVERILSFVIADEPKRAAVVGALAGFVVGVICIFVPHVMFWGEAQLQSMIDKGRTPLPVFGAKGTPTSSLTAYAVCMPDFENDLGFSMGCSALIAVSKIFVTGMSLGTGIIAGHFWGPLFTGCIASHFFTDFVNLVSRHIGFGASLSAYPCVAILCVMGATHVVTFRAHLAIMLILTLTISAFDNGASTGTGGDFSAVFPLLVVSVFVSLMLTRRTVFYGAQRSRGDIMAIGEVLCEPNKEGAPLVLDYEYNHSDEEDDGSVEGGVINEEPKAGLPYDMSPLTISHNNESLTQEDIERSFMARQQAKAPAVASNGLERDKASMTPPRHSRSDSRSGAQQSSVEFRSASPFVATPRDQETKEARDKVGNLPPTTPNSHYRSNSRGSFSGVSQTLPDDLMSMMSSDLDVNVGSSNGWNSSSLSSPPSSRLDELLARPMEAPLGKDKRQSHRRICSASDASASCPSESHHRTPTSINRQGSINGQGSERLLVQVAAYGEISDYQPSLMDQARMRAASSVGVTHRRLPSLPNGARHSRKNSADVSSVMLQTSGYHARKNSDASAAMAHMAIGDAAAVAMASLHMADAASAAMASLALPDVSSVGMSSLDSESGALSQDEIERTFASLQLGARNAHRRAQSRDTNHKYHY